MSAWGGKLDLDIEIPLLRQRWEGQKNIAAVHGPICLAYKRVACQNLEPLVGGIFSPPSSNRSAKPFVPYTFSR